MFCFGAADLQLLLATAGVRNIMLAGVTTDVCVHTTMRVRCCSAALAAQPLECGVLPQELGCYGFLSTCRGGTVRVHCTVCGAGCQRPWV